MYFTVAYLQKYDNSAQRGGMKFYVYINPANSIEFERLLEHLEIELHRLL